MRKVASYSFGHDVDNIRDVQSYVIDTYDEADYNIHVARGDDVMNHMTIYRADDETLDHLIDSCYGEGAFEE
jgi:repressor of nif and glnA expression